MLYVRYSKDNGEIEDIGTFKSETEFEEWLIAQLKLNPDTKILKTGESWGEVEL